MSHYAARDYEVNVAYSQADECFVATCFDFPGITGFGDQPAEALADIYEVLEAAIEIHLEEGYPVPAPSRKPEVALPSGEFRLRIPRVTHYCLAEQARTEGVSQNLLAATLLQDGLTRRSLVGELGHAVNINVGFLMLNAPAELVGTFNERLPEQINGSLKPQQWFDLPRGYADELFAPLSVH